jgi:hypothetical protein
LYCGSSIQGISSVIRGFLFKHTTYFDFQNCHPKILLYLCKTFCIPHPNLEFYCNHRDEVLESEETKITILNIINDGKKFRSLSGFTKELETECKLIHTEILKIPDFLDLIETTPSYNLHGFNGSAINRILCKFENLILQDFLSIINLKGLDICALMFDGVMVYGDFHNQFGVEIIEWATNYINAKWENLNLVIAIKEHDDSIVLPQDYEIPLSPLPIDEYIIQKGLQAKIYSSIKETFELQHFKIINKALFGKQLDDGSVIYMRENEIKVAYKHIHFIDVCRNQDGSSYEVELKFINKLVQDADMRYYLDLGMFPPPLICPKHIFNLWHHFDGEELIVDYDERPEELSFILNHIVILCNNETDIADYFIKWMGQMIQFPATKTLCPTFISQEGAGKGALVDIMRRILGPKKVFESTKPSRDVWGNFNGAMKNAFLVNLNELSSKETLENEGLIKGLITDSALQINEKGVNQYEVKSFHRFIITTNKEEPFETKEGDRRNFIIRCSDQLCGNKEYFDYLYNLIEDDDVMATLYNYLSNIPDLDKFNLLPVPQTQYQRNLRQLTINSILLFVKDFVQENYYSRNERNEPVLEISSKRLYDKFVDWCKINNIPCDDINSIKFGVRLHLLHIKGIDKGKHTRKGNMLSFNFDILKVHLHMDFSDNIESD